MKTQFIDHEIKYDGSQLRSLYSYLNWGILGDSIISWVGPCDISFDKMIDGEDLLQKATICGNRMLHFIIEVFEKDLFSAVVIQRLMASQIKDLLVAHLQSFPPPETSQLIRFSQTVQPGQPTPLLDQFVRNGDDLYFDDSKLSISIASRSPVSVMIHFALNINNSGTPVKTCSLEDFGVLDAKSFAMRVMNKVSEEYDEIIKATQKVRPLY